MGKKNVMSRTGNSSRRFPFVTTDSNESIRKASIFSMICIRKTKFNAQERSHSNGLSIKSIKYKQNANDKNEEIQEKKQTK